MNPSDSMPDISSTQYLVSYLLSLDLDLDLLRLLSRDRDLDRDLEFRSLRLRLRCQISRSFHAYHTAIKNYRLLLRSQLLTALFFLSTLSCACLETESGTSASSPYSSTATCASCPCLCLCRGTCSGGASRTRAPSRDRRPPGPLLRI